MFEKIYHRGTKMNKNILSIFEKHLGAQTPTRTQLTLNIKDTNEIIGALQTINSALKKCQNSIHSPQEINQIVSSCFFMEKPLFGRKIFIPTIEEDFFIENLDEMIQNNHQNIQSYIQSKREEIDQILETILEALDKQDCSSSHQGSQATLTKNLLSI